MKRKGLITLVITLIIISLFLFHKIFYEITHPFAPGEDKINKYQNTTSQYNSADKQMDQPSIKKANKPTSKSDSQSEEPKLEIQTPIMFGDSGENIKLLQKKLTKLGYAVKVDGNFGNTTLDAVLNLQYRTGQEPDGIVGSQTAKLLNAPPNEKTVFNPKQIETTSLNTEASIKSQIEKKINGIDHLSKTNFLIWVDSSKQKVAIFTGSSRQWKLIKYISCASGKSSTPTVKGIFAVEGKGQIFRASATTICKYYTAFYQNYLFHSVLLDNQGNIQDGTLGVAISHGCVRLSMEDAKFIYANITCGTTVWIE